MTKPIIDPEFHALIPPLSEDESALLRDNRLGFYGDLDDGDGWLASLTLMPTPIGSLWWLWSRQSLRTGETYSPHPVALSRMPLREWRGCRLKAVQMEPAYQYPEYGQIPRARLTTVYFIQSVMGGPVKVGHAVDPEARLRQHQTGSPFELRIVRTIADVPVLRERELHRLFSDYRLHGEWFSEKILEIS